MMDPEALRFWLGNEADEAACDPAAIIIENQFWTALFVPEVDLTDPQADE